MKKSEVQVGKYYRAKVGTNLTTVRIDRENGRGFDATNMETNRSVHFKSAMKLRNETAWPVLNKTVLVDKKPDPVLTGLAAALSPVEQVKTAAPHIVVKAYAGTGKTFTEIVGVGWAFGNKVWDKIVRGIAERANKNPEGFKVTPSEEQQLVWNALALSQGISSITYCAFNKRIVQEFSEKWGWMARLLQSECGINLRFATINSLGYQAVGQLGRFRPNNYYTENLIGKKLGWMDPRELRYDEPVLVNATVQLVGLCKLTLAGWTREAGFSPSAITADELDELCAFYDIELNGQRSKVYELVPQILEMALRPEDTGEIDFNDQNWLPVVRNLPIVRSDLGLVDEGQDLNRCKQEFVIKAFRRIGLVGDTYQAIYGFAGADTESIPRMCELLHVTEPLKLTETRRCGKAIVTEAQAIVADFKAHESNPEGLVRHSSMDKYSDEAQDGDMCLCRVNAPLVSQALRLIKDGRKAIINGRDFGGQLLKFIDRMKARDPGELIEKVQKWADEERSKEHKKRSPSEAKLMAIQDKQDCIEAFCEEAITIQDVKNKINQVFAGKQCPRCRKSYDETVERCYNKSCQTERVADSNYPVGPELVRPKGVLYSSIHKAKGLEADRVFFLEPPGATCPHPMAKSKWQVEQEWHLRYVAITRAIQELVYVS